ncbi:MAG: penicillin-binding protein activator [Deltaproteobacteria bacterium]
MILFRLFCLLLLLTAVSKNVRPEELSADDGSGKKYSAHTRTFGCLLPLSGRYRLIGEKALRGILAAAGAGTPGVEYKVIVKDIGEGKGKLDEAFESLGKTENLSFIVGPIPSKFISTISSRVNSAKIPAVVFPISESESSGGPYFIKYYYPLEDQVEALSRYAARELGVRTFGVLYPRTALGERLSRSFAESVRGTGGKLVYQGSYNPESRDVSGEVSWIASVSPDAIFIPDGAASSAEVILKLKRNPDLRDVLFIGPSTWNSPVFFDLVGKEIDGFVFRAIFTDALFYGDDEWKQFSRLFEMEFAHQPDFLEFQLYKAVRLILSLQGSDGGPGRKTLIDSLMSLKNNPAYEIRRDKSGSVQVSPRYRIMSVSDGELIDIMKAR